MVVVSLEDLSILFFALCTINHKDNPLVNSCEIQKVKIFCSEDRPNIYRLTL